MADRVEISNLILTKLGEAATMTDPLDATGAARPISANWNLVRDQVLRGHPWNFATVLVQLTPTTEKPAFGYSHCYQLPPDFLRLDLGRLGPSSIRNDVRLVRGRKLYANYTGAIDLFYVARVEEEGDWDALFVEAFACRLASQIAYRVTGDGSAREKLNNEFRMALSEARNVDGLENPPEPSEPTGWEQSRYGGYSDEPWLR